MRAAKALFSQAAMGKMYSWCQLGPDGCICFEAPFGVRRGGKWVRKLFVFSVLENFLFLFLIKDSIGCKTCVFINWPWWMKGFNQGNLQIGKSQRQILREGARGRGRGKHWRIKRDGGRGWVRVGDNEVKVINTEQSLYILKCSW